MRTFNLRSLIDPANLTTDVQQLLRIEGDVLVTDDGGCDGRMEGGRADARLLVLDGGQYGTVQIMYVVDGHLIASVWFGRDDVRNYSYTYTDLPFVSPDLDPCGQVFGELVGVLPIKSAWVATPSN